MKKENDAISALIKNIKNKPQEWEFGKEIYQLSNLDGSIKILLPYIIILLPTEIRPSFFNTWRLKRAIKHLSLVKLEGATQN